MNMMFLFFSIMAAVFYYKAYVLLVDISKILDNNYSFFIIKIKVSVRIIRHI